MWILFAYINAFYSNKKSNVEISLEINFDLTKTLISLIQSRLGFVNIFEKKCPNRKKMCQ